MGIFTPTTFPSTKLQNRNTTSCCILHRSNKRYVKIDNSQIRQDIRSRFGAKCRGLLGVRLNFFGDFCPHYVSPHRGLKTRRTFLRHGRVSIKKIITPKPRKISEPFLGQNLEGVRGHNGEFFGNFHPNSFPTPQLRKHATCTNTLETTISQLLLHPNAQTGSLTSLIKILRAISSRP